STSATEPSVSCTSGVESALRGASVQLHSTGPSRNSTHGRFISLSSRKGGADVRRQHRTTDQNLRQGPPRAQLHGAEYGALLQGVGPERAMVGGGRGRRS